jgi:hypothetical protein
MHKPRFRHRFTAVLGALIVVSLVAIPVSANNWWGNYHWGRTSDTFILDVGANVGPEWNDALTLATDGVIMDWSDSSVLNMSVVSGAVTDPKLRKKCPPTAGRVEVCSASLGGSYLGVAQLWTSFDKITQANHITQATVKVNDHFYNAPGGVYNNRDQRQSVLCEELGHTIGVDHAYDGTGGCVTGYGASPPPLSPSTHDYEMIVSHYGHINDGTTTVGTTPAVAAREETEIDPREWGAVLENDENGRPSVYGKDLAPGQRVTTFVVYPDEAENATVNDGTDGGVDDGTGGVDDGTVGDGGKREGGKKDSKRDGGKKDGGKHRHDKRHR